MPLIPAPRWLARNFAADRPDQIWLADVSYIPTDEGWLYLAAIKDMARREPDAERQSEVLGWSMADHLRAELCVAALVMALQRHGPPPHGLVHHSDRSGQYAAEPYRAVLERHGITQSMSRRGNRLDNAPMESLFASLKVEHVHQIHYRTRDEARAALLTISKSSTTASASIQAWATEPRPKHGQQRARSGSA